MMTSRVTYLVGAAVWIFVGGDLLAGDQQKVLGELPVEARQEAVTVAARAGGFAGVPTRKDRALDAAWKQFDQQEWKEAVEHFLDAFQEDPGDAHVAEGLAVCLYHMKEYGSAYRLGRELQNEVPEISTILSLMLEGDVRDRIRLGEFEEAAAMLKHFPEQDAKYSNIHRHLSAARALDRAIPAGRDRSADPAS